MGTRAGFVTGATIPADDATAMVTALAMGTTGVGKRAGVTGAENSCLVAPGSGTTVTVKAGTALVPQASGVPLVYESTVDTSLTLDARDATYSRIDRVVLHPTGTAGSEVQIAAIRGTPAAAPLAPDAGTYDLTLALVTVPPGTTPLSVNLTETPRTVAAGAVLPVTSTTRPTGVGSGQVIWETDTGLLLVKNGADWQVVDRRVSVNPTLAYGSVVSGWAPTLVVRGGNATLSGGVVCQYPAAPTRVLSISLAYAPPMVVMQSFTTAQGSTISITASPNGEVMLQPAYGSGTKSGSITLLFSLTWSLLS